MLTGPHRFTNSVWEKATESRLRSNDEVPARDNDGVVLD